MTYKSIIIVGYNEQIVDQLKVNNFDIRLCRTKLSIQYEGLY